MRYSPVSILNFRYKLHTTINIELLHISNYYTSLVIPTSTNFHFSTDKDKNSTPTT